MNQPVATLWVGAARSGKSRLAQQWALRRPGPHHCIATCTDDPTDAEMSSRIARHRADRDPRWNVVEEPTAVVATLVGLQGICVIDCITLWICNLGFTYDWKESAVLAEVDRLAALLAAPPCSVAVVTNEVGAGVVPEHALGRAFRDLQGFANQRLAAACAKVVLVSCGLPLALKGSLPD